MDVAPSDFTQPYLTPPNPTWYSITLIYLNFPSPPYSFCDRFTTSQSTYIGLSPCVYAHYPKSDWRIRWAQRRFWPITLTAFYFIYTTTYTFTYTFTYTIVCTIICTIVCTIIGAAAG